MALLAELHAAARARVLAWAADAFRA